EAGRRRAGVLPARLRPRLDAEAAARPSSARRRRRELLGRAPDRGRRRDSQSPPAAARALRDAPRALRAQPPLPETPQGRGALAEEGRVRDPPQAGDLRRRAPCAASSASSV